MKMFLMEQKESAILKLSLEKTIPEKTKEWEKIIKENDLV